MVVNMGSLSLLSFGGIGLVMVLAFFLSSSRKRIPWKTVGFCLFLQFLFAFLFLYLPWGSRMFLGLSRAIEVLLKSIGQSSHFLFGTLSIPSGEKGSLGFILLFQAFPSIIVFASILAALYYLRVLPVLVELFARGLQRIMPLSGAETLAVVSNIFVGIESLLSIRPYLQKMTESELTTVLTAGMATIASSVLALYTLVLHRVYPNIAAHLISASLLSAPAAILVSKMLVPEQETPETLRESAQAYVEPQANLTEALIKGAEDGLKMVGGIVAVLLVFLSLLYFGDDLLGRATLALLGQSITLSKLLSYLFYPFTYLAGVPFRDAPQLATLLGERLIATELTAYQNLALLLQQGSITLRSAFFASYALCGFAHIASLSIFAGGVAALAPNQRAKLGIVGVRALLAANLATLMTGYIANIFYRSSLLF